MPSSASTVGVVQFPVPAGDPNSPLRDPVKTVLLHLAAHWLNFGLSAKLLNMQPTAKEAVPTDDDDIPINLGEFDPGTTFVGRDLPALYCWCPQSVTEQFTMVQWLRSSEYHMRYYFQPLTVPKGRGARSGVMTDVDRLLHRMNYERRHDTFPTTAVQALLPVTIPVGTSIEKALCLRELKLLRSKIGVAWESPGQSSTAEGITRAIGNNTDGGVQRGFPVLHAVWGVKELVSGDQADGVTDERPDLQLTINATTGEGEGYVEIMTRNVNAPDGAGLNQKDEFD